MRTANGQFWPPADDALLMQRWAGRAVVGEDGWKAIAKSLSMPRTWQSCRQRVQYLRRKASGIPPRKREPKARVVNGRIYRERDGMQEPLAPHQVPRHASPAAALLGDPPLGRSALDRRPPADQITGKMLCDLPRRSPVDQMRAGLA